MLSNHKYTSPSSSPPSPLSITQQNIDIKYRHIFPFARFNLVQEKVRDLLISYMNSQLKSARVPNPSLVFRYFRQWWASPASSSPPPPVVARQWLVHWSKIYFHSLAFNNWHRFVKYFDDHKRSLLVILEVLTRKQQMENFRFWSWPLYDFWCKTKAARLFISAPSKPCGNEQWIDESTASSQYLC